MRFSLQVQYAICGLFDLAYNGHGEPIQVRVIGTRQEIPARYLEQIFQRLRRAKLVTGKRGPGGGYVLARAPADISLCEIVEAVEGPADQWLAAGPAEPGEIPVTEVPYRPSFLWAGLAQRFADTLRNVTLESLCREAAQAGVRRADDDARMYFI